MGMACWSTREGREDRISDRSVRDHSEEQPTLHHGLPRLACGYEFTIAAQSIAHDQEATRLLKERQRQVQLYERFSRGLGEVRQLYSDHVIDSCMPVLQEVEGLYKELDLEQLNVSEGERRELEQFMSNVRYSYQEVVKFARYIDKDGWKEAGEKNGIKIYSRRDNGTVGILTERVIEIPVEIFLSVIGDLDNLTELVPDVKVSREVRQIARNHKLGYCIYDVPVLSLREAIYETVGFNRLGHNNTIFSYSQSIHDKPDICQRIGFAPQLNEKYVQIDYKYIIMEYVPLGVGKGLVRMANNVDMKVSLLPLSILEFISKKFCVDFLEIVMKVSHKFPHSKWEQKVHDHPEAFNFFR